GDVQAAETGRDEDVDRTVEGGLLDAALEVELAVAEVLDAGLHRPGRAVGDDVGPRPAGSLEDHRQIVGGLLVDLVGTLATERTQGAVRQVKDAKADQGALGCLEERHEIEEQT